MRREKSRVTIVSSVQHLEAILELLRQQLCRARRVDAPGDWGRLAKRLVVADILSDIKYVEGMLAKTEEEIVSERRHQERMA